MWIPVISLPDFAQRQAFRSDRHNENPHPVQEHEKRFGYSGISAVDYALRASPGTTP